MSEEIGQINKRNKQGLIPQELVHDQPYPVHKLPSDMQEDFPEFRETK